MHEPTMWATYVQCWFAQQFTLSATFNVFKESVPFCKSVDRSSNIWILIIFCQAFPLLYEFWVSSTVHVHTVCEYLFQLFWMDLMFPFYYFYLLQCSIRLYFHETINLHNYVYHLLGKLALYNLGWNIDVKMNL